MPKLKLEIPGLIELMERSQQLKQKSAMLLAEARRLDERSRKIDAMLAERYRRSEVKSAVIAPSGE